jgi:branched-chain amino acid transport system ATP-binding protein
MSHSAGFLDIVNLSKNFGGLTAVSELTLSVKRNEILSIIGPNGAGKTTIFNLISCFYRPDRGDILFMEKSIKDLLPSQICSRGIARTFQTTRLFRHLSVLENLKVGTHIRTAYGFWDELFRTEKLVRGEKGIERQARELLEEFGLLRLAEEDAGNLPYGVQRLVEILRSLNSRPALLMLDEPAAGMNPQEALSLMGVIEKIRNKGVTILLVEHNMDVVMEISERVVVLNYGKKIAEGSVEDVQKNEEVIAAYLGEDVEENT